mgnify:CR=1 FL=1
MEVERLNLDDFDINTFEPPNFKIGDSFEPISELGLELEQELTDEDSEDQEEDIEISIDENDHIKHECNNLLKSTPFDTSSSNNYSNTSSSTGFLTWVVVGIVMLIVIYFITRV